MIDPVPAPAPAPIAVVALGDPGRRDDGISLRVMGRVRTLIAELRCVRGRAVPERLDSKRWPGGLALESAPPPASRIDWIEGGSDPHKLDAFLVGRRRVVLIDAVRLSGEPGQVHHWHLRCLPGSRLTSLRRFGDNEELGLEHLALWLEDELPERGTDLIGIEPADLREGVGLSRALRRRLSTISSQVTGILIQLLEEEGW